MTDEPNVIKLIEPKPAPGGIAKSGLNRASVEALFAQRVPDEGGVEEVAS